MNGSVESSDKAGERAASCSAEEGNGGLTRGHETVCEVVGRLGKGGRSGRGPVRASKSERRQKVGVESEEKEKGESWSSILLYFRNPPNTFCQLRTAYADRPE